MKQTIMYDGMIEELKVMNYEEIYKPSTKYMAIDEDIAQEDLCQECQSKMHWEGWSMQNFASYRAFAVCNNCNYFEEF